MPRFQLYLYLADILSACWALHLQKESSKLCGDAELNAVVEPVLRDAVELFAEHEVTLFPAAVSAVGALRYGGNAVLVDGKRHILDHDVDFLAVGLPDASWDDFTMGSKYSAVLQGMMRKGWQMGGHTTPIGDLVGTANVIPHFFLGQAKDLKGRKYGDFYMRIKTDPNALGERFNNTELIRLAMQMTKTTLSYARPVIESIERNLAPVAELSDAMEPARFVHLDFFYIRGPQLNYQPHPTKKVFFHGLDMPYPADSTLMIAALQMAFWDEKSDAHQLANGGDICAFSIPGAFPDDMINNDENKRVAHMCSTALRAAGYESFSTLGC